MPVGSQKNQVQFTVLAHSPSDSSSPGSKQEQIDFERRTGLFRRRYVYGRPLICKCAQGDPAHMMYAPVGLCVGTAK
jgi:hypothetical protein